MKLLHEGGFGHRLDELASPKEKDSSISTSLIVHTTTKCIAPICVGYRAERTTGHNGLLDRVLLKCNPTVCVCRERPFGSIMVKKKKKRKKRLRGPKTTEGSPSSSLPGGKKIFFNGSREFRLKGLVVCSKINLEAVGPYSGYFFFRSLSFNGQASGW